MKERWGEGKEGPELKSGKKDLGTGGERERVGDRKGLKWGQIEQVGTNG